MEPNTCDLFGCMYNEDGYCNFKNAPAKIPYYQACRDSDFWGDEQDTI